LIKNFDNNLRQLGGNLMTDQSHQKTDQDKGPPDKSGVFEITFNVKVKAPPEITDALPGIIGAVPSLVQSLQNLTTVLESGALNLSAGNNGTASAAIPKPAAVVESDTIEQRSEPAAAPAAAKPEEEPEAAPPEPEEAAEDQIDFTERLNQLTALRDDPELLELFNLFTDTVYFDFIKTYGEMNRKVASRSKWAKALNVTSYLMKNILIGGKVKIEALGDLVKEKFQTDLNQALNIGAKEKERRQKIDERAAQVDHRISDAFSEISNLNRYLVLARAFRKFIRSKGPERGLTNFYYAIGISPAVINKLDKDPIPDKVGVSIQKARNICLRLDCSLEEALAQGLELTGEQLGEEVIFPDEPGHPDNDTGSDTGLPAGGPATETEDKNPAPGEDSPPPTDERDDEPVDKDGPETPDNTGEETGTGLPVNETTQPADSGEADPAAPPVPTPGESKPIDHLEGKSNFHDLPELLGYFIAYMQDNRRDFLIAKLQSGKKNEATEVDWLAEIGLDQKTWEVIIDPEKGFLRIDLAEKLVDNINALQGISLNLNDALQTGKEILEAGGVPNDVNDFLEDNPAETSSSDRKLTKDEKIHLGQFITLKMKFWIKENDSNEQAFFTQHGIKKGDLQRLCKGKGGLKISDAVPLLKKVDKDALLSDVMAGNFPDSSSTPDPDQAAEKKPTDILNKKEREALVDYIIDFMEDDTMKARFLKEIKENHPTRRRATIMIKNVDQDETLDEVLRCQTA